MLEQITDIKKRVGHRLVLLASGEALTVPHALFRLHPLKVNEEIDVQAYAQIISAAEGRFALEAAVRMLETRDRSHQEIINKLTEFGFSPKSAEQACIKLQTLGYLDDARYAQMTAKRLGKKYGAIRIRRELRNKGIEEQLIEKVLQESDEEDQLAAAISIISKSYARSKGEPQARYRRAYAALARRGYPPEVVKAALDAVIAEIDLE
ncbi:MAG: regulatory protein RecX [Clostridiales bacterium]|nr:regulatory protein RecX [Clostridiales bacterium]